MMTQMGTLIGRDVVERDGGDAILINGLPEHSPIDLGSKVYER